MIHSTHSFNNVYHVIINNCDLSKLNMGCKLINLINERISCSFWILSQTCIIFQCYRLKLSKKTSAISLYRATHTYREMALVVVPNTNSVIFRLWLCERINSTGYIFINFWQCYNVKLVFIELILSNKHFFTVIQRLYGNCIGNSMFRVVVKMNE